MNIKSLVLLSAVLTSFSILAAENLTVYRWVDENNIVHFSQHQPSHDQYTVISMANNRKSSALDDSDNENNTPAPESSVVDNNTTNNVSDDKCNSARKNVATLQGFDKIQYKDEKGKLKVLSAIEKQQQLAMNTKQVEVYCTDK